MLSIMDNPKNHDPMLKIESMSSGSILYTLDGTSPTP